MQRQRFHDLLRSGLFCGAHCIHPRCTSSLGNAFTSARDSAICWCGRLTRESACKCWEVEWSVEGVPGQGTKYVACQRRVLFPLACGGRVAGAGDPPPAGSRGAPQGCHACTKEEPLRMPGCVTGSLQWVSFQIRMRSASHWDLNLELSVVAAKSVFRPFAKSLRIAVCSNS